MQRGPERENRNEGSQQKCGLVGEWCNIGSMTMKLHLALPSLKAFSAVSEKGTSDDHTRGDIPSLSKRWRQLILLPPSFPTSDSDTPQRDLPHNQSTPTDR